MHIKINILVSRILLIIFSVISLAFLVADSSDAAACPAPYSCAGSAICSAEGRVVIGYTCTSGVCCNFSGTTPTPTPTPVPPPPSGSFTLTTSCNSINLRTGPSTSYAAKTQINAGTSVTADAKVSGGSWSVTCPTSASGSSWYRITAINGRSVSSLYGVTYLYAASALFQTSSSPPPTPTPTTYRPPNCPYSCTGSSICSAEGRTVSGYYCSTGVCCEFAASTPTLSPTRTPTPTPTPTPYRPPNCPYSCTGSSICSAEGRTVSGYYCSTGVCCDFSGPTPTPTPTPTPRPTSTPTPTTSSGGYSASCLAPSSNTCGKYSLRNPMGLNFGDPACTYSRNDLYSYLKQVDPAYADRWYYTIIPCESSYNPLSYYGNSTSGRGAWGLYQMNPNECKRYDSGNIDWRRQTTNAVNYNRNLAQNGRAWRYWECAKQWW